MALSLLLAMEMLVIGHDGHHSISLTNSPNGGLHARHLPLQRAFVAVLLLAGLTEYAQDHPALNALPGSVTALQPVRVLRSLPSTCLVPGCGQRTALRQAAANRSREKSFLVNVVSIAALAQYMR